MDTRGVLDQLLQSGKELLKQGRDQAEQTLGVPESGQTRDAMISGLGKGAIAGGLLAMMLGTRAGRNVTGKMVKYGSLAAVAAGAYKAYQAWQDQQQDESTGMSINDLDDQSGEGRGQLLVQAMIAAANADGHINQDELNAIQQQLEKLDLSDEAIAMLQSEFADPMTPGRLADKVDSMAAAAEIYLLSLLVVDETNPAERDYLSQLAAALRLPVELVDNLEQQAFT